MSNSTAEVHGSQAAAAKPHHGLLLGCIRILSTTALLICCYLFRQSLLAGNAVAGCGPGSPCEEVLSSRWSLWWEIPISVPAGLVFLGLLAAALTASPKTPAPWQRRAWGMMVILSSAAGGAAVWFIALQLGAVGHLCPYCMAVHGCGLMIAALVIAGITRLSGGGRDRAYRVIARTRPKPLWALVGGGLLSVAVLIFSQIVAVAEPRLQIVRDDQNTKPSPVERADRLTPTLPAQSDTRPADPDPSAITPDKSIRHEAPRLHHFQVGLFKADIDAGTMPIIGDLDAPNMILVLSDYTCPHCRQMEKTLAQARRRYGRQIVWGIVPLPLSSDCNYFVKKTNPINAHACELAKLAIEVWHADPKAFEPMDEWLFNSPQSRLPEEANAYALQLVSSEALQRTKADAGIGQLIRQNVDLYAAVGAGRIPKLVLPATLIVGEPASAQELFNTLERELKVYPDATQ